MYKIGFIGAGNMGSALAIAAAKQIGGENVCIIDHNPEKMEALVTSCGCVRADNMDQLVRESEYLVLAVKPNVMCKTAEAIAPVLLEDAVHKVPHILVTIAAGVPTASIRKWTQMTYPVLRLMPNTPVAIGKGTTLLTGSQDVPDEIIAEFLQIMNAAGSFERIDEAKMDITSSINGCAPAYAYMFIESLADGAVQVGVPRDMAIRLAAQTVLGAAAMILETGKHPDKLKDEVCSPGGSTIVGVEALEANGFRYAAAQSIVKSTEKNCSLGKS